MFSAQPLNRQTNHHLSLCWRDLSGLRRLPRIFLAQRTSYFDVASQHHPFAGLLPIFALLLAVLTRWFVRQCKWDSPSFGMLFAVYAIGILSHIFLI